MQNHDIQVILRPAFRARKGAVVVSVAILMTALLGCVALAVDIGYLYVARTELQTGADAAAMAAAQALGRPSGSPFGEYLSTSQIYNRAQSFAQANKCAGKHIALDPQTDVTVGYLTDPRNMYEDLQIRPLDSCNAVRVVVHRITGGNGEVPLFFAPLWGIRSSAVSATAIAVLDDRFYAYGPGANGGPAIPLVMSQQSWNDDIVAGAGSDLYGYDSISQDIIASPDGVRETKLFPEKSKGKGEGVVPGNFGLLNIGSGNNGVPALRVQINNGITADDFTSLTGQPLIKFINPNNGAAVSYQIGGTPGIKAGLEDALSAKVGQKVGFFIYSTVSGNGANSVFTIVGMKFGRVMKVDLGGGDKAIIIQPVPYYGSQILTSPNAPSTGRATGSLQLAR